MAANQFNVPIVLGMPFAPPTTSAPSASTLALSGAASATWLAYSFMPDQNKTLTDVWVFMSAMTGVLAANDISCQIYSNSSSFIPNADLSAGGVVASAVPSAGTWINFTGMSVALTAGTTYWIVLKNPATTSGNSATVFPTYQWFAATLPNYSTPNTGVNTTTPNGQYGHVKTQSANSGSTWTTSGNQLAGWRVGYNDGTYEGFPMSGFNVVPSTAKCFNNGTSSQEYGFKFTSPANAAINVKAISLLFSQATGVGPVEMKLYTGASASACTLAAVTETFAASIVANGSLFVFHFASDVVLQPSTVCRVTLADTSSTGSATKYFTPALITMDANTPAALIPFDGTMVQTTTPNGASVIGNAPGTTFTDSTVGTLGFMGLLLDTNGEFSSFF